LQELLLQPLQCSMKPKIKRNKTDLIKKTNQ
jgi:hypothetical protein